MPSGSSIKAPSSHSSSETLKSTLHRYREEVEHHIGPMLGRHRLDKLTPADLTSFYRHRVTVLSVGSVRRMHAKPPAGAQRGSAMATHPQQPGGTR
ncbi:tyrosine-type recombinase/integrase [Micromonospora chersina]